VMFDVGGIIAVTRDVLGHTWRKLGVIHTLE